MNPSGCFLDDEGVEVIAVEAAESTGHRQGLWVRVGPVFYGNEKAAEPGIWITYQEEYMGSELQGPVLLTPQVWWQLSRAVNRRLRWQRTRSALRRVRSVLPEKEPPQ